MPLRTLCTPRSPPTQQAKSDVLVGTALAPMALLWPGRSKTRPGGASSRGCSSPKLQQQPNAPALSKPHERPSLETSTGRKYVKDAGHALFPRLHVVVVRVSALSFAPPRTKHRAGDREHHDAAGFTGRISTTRTRPRPASTLSMPQSRPRDAGALSATV